MYVYPNEKNKILVFDDDPQRHDNLLTNKMLSFLKDKYRNLIKERNYNINNFRPKIIKEVKGMNYIVLPNYDSFCQRIERIFLKEISPYYNHKNSGILSTSKIDNILCKKYEYSLHFPLKKKI